MFKFSKSSKVEDDVSISFHRDNETRKQSISHKKKRNDQSRYFFQDIFGSADQQQSALFCLLYELPPLQRNSDNNVFVHGTQVGNVEADRQAGNKLWTQKLI